jgi:hypothetical protein
MIRLLAHPPPPLLVNKSSLILNLPVCRRSNILTKRGGGGQGAKSYDRAKAWPSTNHSILSACLTEDVIVWLAYIKKILKILVVHILVKS